MPHKRWNGAQPLEAKLLSSRDIVIVDRRFSAGKESKEDLRVPEGRLKSDPGHLPFERRPGKPNRLMVHRLPGNELPG